MFFPDKVVSNHFQDRFPIDFLRFQDSKILFSHDNNTTDFTLTVIQISNMGLKAENQVQSDFGYKTLSLAKWLFK